MLEGIRPARGWERGCTNLMWGVGSLLALAGLAYPVGLAISRSDVELVGRPVDPDNHTCGVPR